MTMRNFGRFSVVLAAMIAGGCGSDSKAPATAPVSGTVTYKGNPVADATVAFYNDTAPRAAYGVTDKDGKFDLSTFGTKDGAVVGDHVATVAIGGAANSATGNTAVQPPKDPNDLLKMGGITDLGGAKKPDSGDKAAGEKSVPAKYGKKESSPLKYTVVAKGPNNFAIELTD